MTEEHSHLSGLVLVGNLLVADMLVDKTFNFLPKSG
jgi:hypothetical protein